jgi:hypothetical protein
MWLAQTRPELILVLDMNLTIGYATRKQKLPEAVDHGIILRANDLNSLKMLACKQSISSPTHECSRYFSMLQTEKKHTSFTCMVHT